MDNAAIKEFIEKNANLKATIFKELDKVIVGQKRTLEEVIITLLAGGHCLLIGVPGLGKTMIVKSISQLFDLQFKRIQFTPDLMPADIVGTDVLEEDKLTGHREVKFIKGPIFTNLLLADEINRTPPKTQAALLEAMGEYQVTAGGNTYYLAQPFFTLASQNPIEQEGTYPLPEAQLDRFLLSIELEYLSVEDEAKMVLKTTQNTQDKINIVLSAEDILMAQKLVREVIVPDNVLMLAVKLAYSTRPNLEISPAIVNSFVKYGAGSRASQSLILAAKAKAFLDGRFNVSREDVLEIARPVLKHRMALNFKARAENISIEDVIKELIKNAQ